MHLQPNAAAAAAACMPAKVSSKPPELHVFFVKSWPYRRVCRSADEMVVYAAHLALKTR